jgi:hypothetical protein
MQLRTFVVWVISHSLAAAAASPLETFLPPLEGVYAANADCAPVTQTTDIVTCAQQCLDNKECVSFNVCVNGTGFRCGLQSFSMGYRPAISAPCALYTRIRPRNDSRSVQAIPWAATSPAPGNVALDADALIGKTFILHHDLYLSVRSPQDMLYWFYERAKKPIPAGAQCFGWDGWIKGSATGNYLMGAGSYLQWAEDATLRENVRTVVDGIVSLQESNGWVWAFNESDIDTDNYPDYCASWVTRGLLDAHRAGIAGALDINRQAISIFNNHSKLAWFLPQNGGPNPVQPYPSGFNNATNGGFGNGPGHMIYIE